MKQKITLIIAFFALSFCYGQKTWTAGAWVPAGAPGIGDTVSIEDNYNTGTDGSFTGLSLTVEANNTLTVSNNSYIEIQNGITVDALGTIIVNPQGSVVQNNDAALVTNNGTITVEIETTLLNSWLEYTYWSSPVETEAIEDTFGVVNSSRRFYFKAENFVDTQAEIGNTGTYNMGVSDDIDDNGNDWQIASGTMTPGVGYATTGSQFGMFPAKQKYLFMGAFNNGAITHTLINNSGGTYNDWNFIGNPYPSAISTVDFFTTNTNVNTIYLWSHATSANANASGNEGSNFSTNDYATIAANGMTAAGGDITLIPNLFVPAGQGFFVEALTATDVTFNNAMRETGNNDQFFRTTNNREGVWVNLTSDNGIANQIAIGYLNGASKENDGSFHDVKRNLSAKSAAILYSNIENNDDKFVIQGKAPIDLNEDEVISLGFKTNIDVATIYTLSIAQFEGDFFNNNAVYLKDNLLNQLHNLKNSDYNFTSNVGEFNERFEIVFNSDALSINDNLVDESALSIIEHKNGDVHFKLNANNASMVSIEIIDLQGRNLHRFSINTIDSTHNLSNLSQAPYFAKIDLSNGQTIVKKAIKQY